MVLIRLSTPSSPSALRADDAAVRLAEEDLHRDRPCARVVAGVRVRIQEDLFVVDVAAALERLLVDAGPCRRRTEHADDRRALRAAEARVAPGDHVGRDAALPIGRPRQCDEARFTGDGVLHLDRIAHGEDVGIGRAHLIVDANAAAFADLQAGRAREVGVGTHAEREDHDVGRIHLPGLRAHVQRAFVALLERGHAVVELDAHAVPNEVIFHQAAPCPCRAAPAPGRPSRRA